MGDLTDDVHDMTIQQQAEFDAELEVWLELDDRALCFATTMARKPLVIAIRNHYAKYLKLSKKQRYVLARWCVEKNHGPTQTI